MCHIACIIYGAKSISKEEIRGKQVIEVGSNDVNGSLRPLLESWEPSKYVGVDIKKGRGVDVICNAENLAEKFGKESFDFILSTELLEHVKDWRRIISNFKNICKPEGIILITTRSRGAAYHAFPNDFWRYEVEDMREIFSDFNILSLEKDLIGIGVFIKVQKPNDFKEKNLSDFKLYSIVSNNRTKEITDKDLNSFYYKKLMFKNRVKILVARVYHVFF